MAETRFEISESDIDSLAAKLDSMGDRLNEQDRKVLIAAFKLAGDQLQKRVAGEEAGVASFSWTRGATAMPVSGLPSLSSGLKAGFYKSFRQRNFGGNPTAIDDKIRDSIDI